MPRDLKVLFVSNLFPDAAQPYRGLDNATLLHHLEEHCEIRVISPRPALPFRWRVPEPRSEDQSLAPLYVPAGYVPKIGSRWNHRLMARALRAPLLAAKTAFAFDVVLCSWLYPDACAVSLLAEESAFPFAAISQGSDAHQYLRMPVRRKAIAHALERCGRVVTRSAELGRLLAGVGVASEKLQTIYNGVDLALFQPGDRQAARSELSLPAAAPIILFVGNFFPVKDPLLLVRSHRRLRQSLPDCRLLMIGGGGLEASIRAEAAEGLHLLGRRSSPEIARYMQAADVLCVPSRNEGVPNVILEAFATGLRVVATRVGGIPEVLSDGDLGKLVTAGDEEALAASLAEVLRLPCDVSRVRAHGSQFSWEKAVSKYREALEAASARPASAVLFREATPAEVRLLNALLAKSAGLGLPSDLPHNLRVQNMADGGMGSLLLVQNDQSAVGRAFGRIASEIQFTDADGVVVIASLNLDRAGDLFELDIWKTDFSPLIRVPEKFH